MPEGTEYWRGYECVFRWRAFKISHRFIACHPNFNWSCHIRETFYDCMKPMYDRMQRVV